MKPAPRRADAVQNRARIIKAARAAVGSSDELKLNAIAKQAGVGQGTLYRHFPTREDLLAEVYRADVDELVAADARDVILLIGYLSRLDEAESDIRARHPLTIILDGLRTS
jgi:AcrR family transcriptional regulator